ncbi:hypothetical protein HBH64_155900 [Parastagonospora nodorum]|nr:hypothetical protein HBI01_153560 [Parastagonospora nodorum]KAH4298036.1 hypothetical protein HBI02_159380 [Parastagonospora nodorum]KAH4326328.1 hypothetical protein HBI00_144430 [Parastagonospora nodorum]KAH4364485.1 hypothetical protein HBH94_163950 [Parastagonospora nodorum]KAH4460773.1 hypothetical protein HBH90_143560 [Parastagonospora nodorum]
MVILYFSFLSFHSEIPPSSSLPHSFPQTQHNVMSYPAACLNSFQTRIRCLGHVQGHPSTPRLPNRYSLRSPPPKKIS